MLPLIFINNIKIKNMKQTAEEILNKHLVPANAMIEFAKLHVEAALQAAAETNYPSTKANFELVNSRILNAYPLENIK